MKSPPQIHIVMPLSASMILSGVFVIMQLTPRSRSSLAFSTVIDRPCVDEVIYVLVYPLHIGLSINLFEIWVVRFVICVRHQSMDFGIKSTGYI